MIYSADPSGNVTMRAVDALLAPQLTGQPVQQVASPGDIATFSVVVADAHAVTYQWMFNGIDIPGATGDSLLLRNISAADEGQYVVVAKNAAGSVASAPAALLLDRDRDGLPDNWETVNFGSVTAQRTEGDPDGDGISNRDEFVDGTNPNDKGSFRPRLIAYGGAGGSVTVTPMKLSYDLGEAVTLTPNQVPPSIFMGWEGDLGGAVNPATVTMDRNKTVRGRFAAAASLAPGLIALWRGEGDASDLVGGRDGTFFTGTVATAPSITASGKVGAAFDLDGTVHVRVPDAAELRPARFTVEAWVFPTVASGSFQTIVARGSSLDDSDTWALGVANNRPQFFSHGFHLLEGTSDVPLNAWTHLAIAFDGRFKRLYVNGAQVTSPDENLGALVYDPAPVPVTIGSDWTSNVTNARFNGRIDELALYGRALTLDEIQGIASADFLGKNFSQPYFTSSERLPSAALGVNYAQRLTTMLGTLPVSFSLSGGALPPGIGLSSDGLVSGTCTAAGVYEFSVTARDAVGQAKEQDCFIRVS